MLFFFVINISFSFCFLELCDMKQNKAYLQEGDKIGLITASSPISKDDLDKAVSNIQSLGLHAEYLPSVLERRGFWAGSPESRARELYYFFDRSDIEAVMAVRGGYGSFELLPLLDYEFIASCAKPLIGYSDVSALLNSLHFRSGIPALHGPMALGGFSDFSRRCFCEVFFSSHPQIKLKGVENESYTLQPGLAEGRLIGGNLSVILSLLGTEYEPDFRQKILFLEEVNEPPYKIHRMLTQLKAAGHLSVVSGIAFGRFSGCENMTPKEKAENFSLPEVLEMIVNEIEKPAVYGLPFGHVNDNAFLPIGARAVLDTNVKELIISGFTGNYA